MKAALASHPADSDFDALLRAARWADVCALYERGLSRDEKEFGENRVAYAIALIRSDRVKSGVSRLTPDLVALPGTAQSLRRYLLSFLIKDRRFEVAIAILNLLLSNDPESIEDLRLRGSLLGRTRQYEGSIIDARRLIELKPDDVIGHTAYLQLLLQSDQVGTAAEHAKVLGHKPVAHGRLLNMSLLAMSRAGLVSEAIALAKRAEDLTNWDADAAQAVVRVYFEAGDTETAITRGEASLDAGVDGPKLRHFLGQAYLSRGTEGLERAIVHLEAAAAYKPADPNSLALLGEALLRSGRHSDSIPYLSEACRRLPRVPHVRSLYARALKQSGRVAEASREYRELLNLQPNSHRWHRHAAGALSQAGHSAEAADLFDTLVARRASSLPDNFDAGLERLWDKVDEVTIPQDRLDWAWELRADRQADRTQWERAARWGNLADHYLLDWLECRDTQAHEAMLRLADLSNIEQIFKQIDLSKGAVLASAHIGPMYAGPLALELLGIRSKWLASTPSVARTSYARSLISTSDQSGIEVARRVMESLRQGDAVVIAIDGAINLAAPRVPFEGQEITYSSFASRMAHRLGIPSIFVAPHWVDGQIGFTVERMPDAQPGENADDHAERWQDAYLASLRRYLSGAPENLRLSGGLWRHIRAPQEPHG